MGYYRRVLSLKKTAQAILNSFQGTIPDNPQALVDLPGVGPYTANAVAAIAYNKPCLALDGNAVRVLSRLFAFEKDASKSSSRRELACLGMRIMPPGKASAFNQALMELGALICRPKKPLCTSCPASKGCKGLKENRVAKFPINPKRGGMVRKNLVLGLVIHQGLVLLSKRPQGALLGGLWELPHRELLEDSEFESELVRFLWTRFRLLISIEGYLGDIRHTVSRFRMHAKVFLGYPSPSIPQLFPKEGLFILLEDLNLYPMTALSHKALNLWKKLSMLPMGFQRKGEGALSIQQAEAKHHSSYHKEGKAKAQQGNRDPLGV
jgi:A/G-specific adenine glycosylase